MPSVAPLCCALAVIGLLLPWNPIAFEQHSSPEPAPKLALLQRSVKINVARKQQVTIAAGRPLRRPIADFAYPSRNKCMSSGEPRCGQGLEVILSARHRAHSAGLF